MPRKHVVLTLALGASLASIAWSADEPAPAAASSASQTAPAQPAATTPSASSDAAKAPAKEETQADADEKHVLARGYKKETHGNQTVYCRKEVKTGSHFETKICGTAESLALQERQARDLMQSQSAAGSKTN